MRFSVIITTFNRADTLRRAVDSVLAQEGSCELVIVDDGSTDSTPVYLDQLAGPRVNVITRPNGGLSAARNTGLEHATGEWTVFLDDDDVALPGWLTTFAGLTGPTVGVICCAVEYRQPDGTFCEAARPYAMGPMFNEQTGLFLAGSFACRTNLLRTVGGYDEQMTCAHQTELALRLTAELSHRSLSIANTNDIRLRVERRAPDGRPLSSPDALFHGTGHMLRKHRKLFASNSSARARTLGIHGVSAARLERWPEARLALLSSAQAEPTSVRRWFRVVTALFPPLARRVWRTSDYQTQAAA